MGPHQEAPALSDVLSCFYPRKAGFFSLVNRLARAMHKNKTHTRAHTPCLHERVGVVDVEPDAPLLIVRTGLRQDLSSMVSFGRRERCTARENNARRNKRGVGRNQHVDYFKIAMKSEVVMMILMALRYTSDPKEGRWRAKTAPSTRAYYWRSRHQRTIRVPVTQRAPSQP